MKRLAALVLLALGMANAAVADERQFQQALLEWEALYRPLTTAKGRALVEVANRVAEQSATKEEAVLKSVNESGATFSKRMKVLEKNVEALRRAYARADEKERRVLARLAGMLGDVFYGTPMPIYPFCGTGLDESLTYNARWVFGEWVGREPAKYLGLLDDADPRVAELAASTLQTRFPEAVEDRIAVWQQSRDPRFRGLAAKKAQNLAPADAQRVWERLLSDPNPLIRKAAMDFLSHLRKSRPASSNGTPHSTQPDSAIQ